MAQYAHLPVYVKTYDFAKYTYILVRQFRREYKFTLGTELQGIIWQVLDAIIQANSLAGADKRKGICKISLLFDRFKIRLRFAYEIGLVTDRKFAFAQRMMEEIGRMIGGWQKWAGR